MGEAITRTREEWANTITHAAGLVLGLVGLGVFVGFGPSQADFGRFASSLVFVGTLVFLYAASTLFHSLRRPRWKRLFRVVDHVAVYHLIAGTYTPVLVTFLNGAWSLGMLIAVWSLAAAGTVYKLFFTGRYPVFSTGLYVAMGWLGLVALGPLLAQMPPGCQGWLLAGGLCYTVGVAFYVWEGLPYHHTIWHLFVLAGSACHYVAVARYVLFA